MADNKNIGVITEQGFVEGSGLGFAPIAENELNKDDHTKADKKEDIDH